MNRDDFTDAVTLALRFTEAYDITVDRGERDKPDRVSYYALEFAYKLGLWWQDAVEAGMTIEEDDP